MRIKSLLLAAGLTLAGTAVKAQSVTYDYDKSADFARIRTYTWIKGTNVRDELNHKRIVQAIDAQLAAHGLTKVEAAAGADALVAYHATFDTEKQITGFSSGFGGSWRFGGETRSGSARTQDIVEGTLIVDIADAKTGSTMWRGTASREIDTKASAEKRDKNVAKAAEKLFKNYPPKA